MAKCFGKSIVGTSGVNGDAFYISSDKSTIVLADGASGAGADGLHAWYAPGVAESGLLL